MTINEKVLCACSKNVDEWSCSTWLSLDKMQFIHVIMILLIKFRHKKFHSYICYHTLSAYLSFHKFLSYNIKIHYFRDNYA